MGRPPSSDEADWGAFATTVLRFDSAPAFAIDLRQPVDRTARRWFREIGFERSFGVVTAMDPMGVKQTREVNQRLAASLQKEVAGLGVAKARVDACSTDESHCEGSVAIALELNSVVDLAYRHEQLALFWFDGESFWIVPARSNKEKLRLPAIA